MKNYKSKQIKKIKKHITATTVMLAILFLIIGAGVGYGSFALVCKNDKFELKGETSIVLNVGDVATYTEEGFNAICFGKDVSKDVIIETNLTGTNGVYTIDTSEPNEFYIKYTIKNFRFSEVVKYRVITIQEVA